MKPNFQDILRQFRFEGDYSSANPYGVGHINDTYAAVFEENGSIHQYILQQINHNVFLNPEGMMRNIEVVTSHLSRKIKILGGDPRRETLTSFPTVDGNSYLRAEEGNYWRGYHFIGNASTFEVAENLGQVYNAAKAFGKFQNLLSDYPSEQLIETIPDFHNTRVRFDTFIEAVESDDLNRASLSKPEIAFVMQREKDTSVLVDKRERGGCRISKVDR